MAARLGWLAALAGLQLVALVLAHDLTFLARYGSQFGEALAHAGHGEAWSTAVATSAILALALAALAGARLASLGMLLRRRSLAAHTSWVHAAATPPTARPPVAGRVGAALRLGLAMAALNAGLLTIQENIEHAAIGSTPGGMAILLGPEYAGGLWIALAVGLLVGLVAALFRWRVAALLARLRALPPAGGRRTPRRERRTGLEGLLPHASILGRRSALRAPPPAAAL